MIEKITYGLVATLLSLTANLCAFFLVRKESQYRLAHPFSLILMAVSAFFCLELLAKIQSFSSASKLTHIIFFWTLLVTAFTDAQTLLISRWTSLFIAPIGLLASNMGLLSITPLASISGALVGLLVLSFTARLAHRYTGQESIGQGDIDLLICIGAFLGPMGCWRSLLFGSILGSLLGLTLFLFYGTQARYYKLPFGTFLSIGAMVELLIQLPGHLPFMLKSLSLLLD